MDKSKKSKTTTTETETTDERTETAEQIGEGDTETETTDRAPPTQSYSRRNFRFPWLLLGIFGAAVSLLAFRLRHRQPDPHDGMSVSV